MFELLTSTSCEHIQDSVVQLNSWTRLTLHPSSLIRPVNGVFCLCAGELSLGYEGR